MMPTYNELQKQIAYLQQKAESVRSEERDEAISQIKILMNDYGITVADLNSKGKERTKPRKVANAQFRDDSGNTWSGRGRTPAWLNGKNKEQFRIR